MRCSVDGARVPHRRIASVAIARAARLTGYPMQYARGVRTCVLTWIARGGDALTRTSLCLHSYRKGLPQESEGARAPPCHRVSVCEWDGRACLEACAGQRQSTTCDQHAAFHCICCICTLIPHDINGSQDQHTTRDAERQCDYFHSRKREPHCPQPTSMRRRRAASHPPGPWTRLHFGSGGVWGCSSSGGVWGCSSSSCSSSPTVPLPPPAPLARRSVLNPSLTASAYGASVRPLPKGEGKPGILSPIPNTDPFTTFQLVFPNM